MAKNSGRRFLSFLFLLVFIGGSSLFFLRGCSENISPEAANIALTEGGKTYLYSAMGTFIVENSIAKGESPSVITSIEVYKNNEVYFVAPNRLEPLADVCGGNIKHFEYEEPSYNGYIASPDGSSTSYAFNTKVKTTETIGEQLNVSVVTLTNSEGETMEIEWSVNSSDGEYQAISNCEVRSFWKQTNPAPGETVISAEESLVIGLDAIANFYGCGVTYDPDTRVIFVEK